EQLPELDPESELVIYRVAQEALTNVARHSGSRRAHLSLQARNGQLVLAVSDHGSGPPADGEGGTGIRGMGERAGLIGARLRIAANDDGGCTVALSVATARAGVGP